MRQLSTTLTASLTRGTSTIMDEIRTLTLSHSICDGSNPTIGGAYAATLEITMEPASFAVSGLPWVLWAGETQVGVYYLDAPKREGDLWRVTGADAMLGREDRSALGLAAGLQGKNALVDSGGNVVYRWFAKAGKTLTADHYYSKTVSDTAWTLGRLENHLDSGVVAVGEGDTIATANSGLTQSAMTALLTSCALSFKPMELTIVDGIDIEVGDIIEVDGDQMPVMSVEHQYDGGWKTTLRSVGQLNTDSGTGYVAPMTEALRRITADVADINELFANKIKAEYIDVDSLFAQTVDTGGAVANSRGISLDADCRLYTKDANGTGRTTAAMYWHPTDNEYRYEFGTGMVNNNVKIGNSTTSSILLRTKGRDVYPARIGTRIDGSLPAAGVAVESTTSKWTNLASVTLSAGVWIVIGHVEFPADVNGMRAGSIADASDAGSFPVRINASSYGVTGVEITRVFQPTANTDIFLNAQQNSGASLTIKFIRFHAIRIA